MAANSPDLDGPMPANRGDTGPQSVQTSVKVYDNQELVFSTSLSEPLDIGRQREGEPEPYCRIKTAEGARVIIAGLRETTIARRHVRLEPQAAGKIRIINPSDRSPIQLESTGALQPGETCDADVPILLTVGSRVIRVMPVQPEKQEFLGLAQPTLAPGQSSRHLTLFADLVANRSGVVQPKTLITWLQSTMQVFQNAASSTDFLSSAARAVVDIVDLDSAAMLHYAGKKWRLESVHVRSGESVRDAWHPSRTILEQVRKEKRTFREVPDEDSRSPHSLVGVTALVAAPILDQRGEVIGALYGDRHESRIRGGLPEISELEAMLVELLATGVAAGLARLEQEQAAMEARVRFEQFFTLELASKLEAEPDMLASKDTEVTVLFCDLRGFSRITERLGPARTLAWVSDVLGEMSDCVIDHQGVLVDYVGDEIMAMWGAPEHQPNHPQLACRAAMEMVAKLPMLNEKWEEEIGEPVVLGIGLHTGMALVGNTGTHRKFKYGALGNTVNLASRVQNTTKHVNSPLLITGATAEKLTSDFYTRRLCQVRVVNIAEPVTLYELVPVATKPWIELKQHYEEALVAFESGRFLSATRILGHLLDECPNDGPTRVLLLRSVSTLAEESAPFDPVWELSSK